MSQRKIIYSDCTSASKSLTVVIIFGSVMFESDIGRLINKEGVMKSKDSGQRAVAATKAAVDAIQNA